MRIWQHLQRPPWRTLLLLLAVLGGIAVAYRLWSPGQTIIDGRHDRGTNGIWLQHGWLGDDQWFARTGRGQALFRNTPRIEGLARLLSAHGIQYVFPHLCPCDPMGAIPPVDHPQTELFLDHFAGFRVLPWVGGVLDVHCSPESERWRREFIASVQDLLQTHPRLAGIQINIEPMPSGNEPFLTLLRELRQALPDGKILSVAAYPPPTRWHPFPDVHWDEHYFQQVAAQVDQMAVMMYDTALRVPKLYQSLTSRWTQEVVTWAGETEVLLGLPAYDDAGVGYHDPRVENLKNGLQGLHAGLSHFAKLPANYQGIAIYCEWEMDPPEWAYLEAHFTRNR
jgi:hypothetical protein